MELFKKILHPRVARQMTFYPPFYNFHFLLLNECHFRFKSEILSVRIAQFNSSAQYSCLKKIVLLLDYGTVLKIILYCLAAKSVLNQSRNQLIRIVLVLSPSKLLAVFTYTKNRWTHHFFGTRRLMGKVQHWTYYLHAEHKQWHKKFL